jgi:hypothetical protein
MLQLYEEWAVFFGGLAQFVLLFLLHDLLYLLPLIVHLLANDFIEALFFAAHQADQAEHSIGKYSLSTQRIDARKSWNLRSCTGHMYAVML